jgi:hypothetical protein
MSDFIKDSGTVVNNIVFYDGLAMVSAVYVSGVELVKEGKMTVEQAEGFGFACDTLLGMFDDVNEAHGFPRLFDRQ